MDRMNGEPCPLCGALRLGPLVQIAKYWGQGQYVLYNLRWEGGNNLARVINDQKSFKAVWVGFNAFSSYEEWHRHFIAELELAK